MQTQGVCKRCRGLMAVLDIFAEGYDLICTRCGDREIIVRRLIEPPPCYQ